MRPLLNFPTILPVTLAMKGLSEWDEEKQLWTPLVGVFQSEDDEDVVSSVYAALWFDRHWSEARRDGIEWEAFLKGGVLKYRPKNGDVWRPEDLSGQGDFRTLLSYSTACLVCRDLKVVQSILVGSHIYLCLARRSPSTEPDVSQLVRVARVLHL